MNIIKKYLEYLKDNPKGYWFKRKLYGWGWTPAKWQGWVVILVYLLSIFLLSLNINENSPAKEVTNDFLIPIIVFTVILIGICYMKGEKPRWQWGERDEK